MSGMEIESQDLQVLTDKEKSGKQCAINSEPNLIQSIQSHA